MDLTSTSGGHNLEDVRPPGAQVPLCASASAGNNAGLCPLVRKNVRLKLTLDSLVSEFNYESFAAIRSKKTRMLRMSRKKLSKSNDLVVIIKSNKK